jgi:tetratricopeptide (TPR) repeat protein
MTPSIKPLAFVLFATGLMALGGCAENDARPQTKSSFGSYLAARNATAENDMEAASTFYARALKADPANSTVREQAFSLAMLAGDEARAIVLANDLVVEKPDHQLARLLLSLAAIKRGDYANAQTQINLAQKGPFVTLVGTLIEGWAAAGAGNKEMALAKFKSFGGKNQSAFDLFVTYHQALMFDLLQQPEAAAAYRRAMELSNSASIRIVEAYASYLSRQGGNIAARDVLETYAQSSPEHPIIDGSLALLAEDKTLPTIVATPSEGAAEVLYGLGGALSQDGGNVVSELYLRLALYMRPDLDVARTLLAAGYESKERWKDAIAVYSQIEEGTPLYGNARIQTAFALVKLKKEDEAMKILRRMSPSGSTAVEPIVALGDILRGNEKYAQAAEQYTKAIAVAGEPTPARWPIFYARGICYERVGEWQLAERDLKLALELSDNHPLVLNYLGYSWIEKGENLKEALAMIEKAVELRPTDGFIVDSLGWAHYQLGNYSDAVSYLERAVELEPNDATINEHLGDALWKVGRVVEARFQWKHALNMNPEEKRIALLRAKLLSGLEAGDKGGGQSVSPASGS